jgi:hypothetical protein
MIVRAICREVFEVVCPGIHVITCTVHTYINVCAGAVLRCVPTISVAVLTCYGAVVWNGR